MQKNDDMDVKNDEYENKHRRSPVILLLLLLLTMLYLSSMSPPTPPQMKDSATPDMTRDTIHPYLALGPSHRNRGVVPSDGPPTSVRDLSSRRRWCAPVVPLAEV